MIRFSIIVAVANNRAIGKDNHLIYRLPYDLKRFKSLTVGNTVIMGRRTFESLPKGALPNRRNIVLSRTGKAEDFPGADLFRSLPEALADCRARSEEQGEVAEVFAIGGSSVYGEALPLADRLCLTAIDDTPADADTFFPPYEADDWQEVSREHHEPDDRHVVPYDFVDLERRAVSAASLG